MTQTYGPFAAPSAGDALGQDVYLDGLGPILAGDDGVFTSQLGGPLLQVYGNSSGMQVLMRSGAAVSRGAVYQNTADVTLTIAANSSGSTRIDQVVLRNDRAHSGGGQIYPFVITGTPGAGAPAITNTVGGVWDIPLAQVTVAAGATGISPGNVADNRKYYSTRIRMYDSRFTSQGPPDGSQGPKVCYDMNPSFPGLVVSDGTNWHQVATVDFVVNSVTSVTAAFPGLFDTRFATAYAAAGADTGWENLSWNTGNWDLISGVNGPQFRFRNGVVDVWFGLLFHPTIFGGSPQPAAVCTIPAGYWPQSFMGGRRYPVSHISITDSTRGDPGVGASDPDAGANSFITINTSTGVVTFTPKGSAVFANAAVYASFSYMP